MIHSGASTKRLSRPLRVGEPSITLRPVGGTGQCPGATGPSAAFDFGVGERRGSGPLSRPHAGGVTAISPGSRRTRRAPGVSEPARSAVERSAAVRDSTSPRPQRPTHQLVTARKGSYRDRTRVASCSTRIDTQRLRSRLPTYETRHRSLDRRLTTYTNSGCAASTPRSGANGCDASSVEDFFRGRDCEGRGHGAPVLRNLLSSSDRWT